jgi:signal peptide peptidase SppA
MITLKAMIQRLLKKILKQKKSIVLVKLEGIIGAGNSFKSGLSLDSINNKLEQAFSFKKTAAVILLINSPGGSPVQSELIYNKVRKLAQEKSIKVLCFTEDVAASGGYWLACAADEIYSAKNSVIGSIGVISTSFGFEKAIDKLGIERRIFTAGKSKAVLDPFSSIKEEDVKILTSVQKDIHQNFKEVVSERRKNLLIDKEEEIFSGAFWSSKKAKELGLIDDIIDLNQFIEDRYGKEIKIRKIDSQKSWFKRKIGLETFIDSLLDTIIQKLISRNITNFH